jgi:hypothetical protein
MALIRNIFWFAVFLGSTFAFTVLFEHGPNNFAQNAREEAQVLKAMATGNLGARKEADKAKADGAK